MARVTLPIKSHNRRTWAAKDFLEDWAGDWRAEIRAANGYQLKALSFELH